LLPPAAVHFSQPALAPLSPPPPCRLARTRADRATLRLHSWDVGLLGMCTGEAREVVVPPALAYGRAGLPRRGVPPNATLAYEVELVSVNSNFLCNVE
jgi:FKBP-type peptidyl-prolyl cis-trans isomerase